MKKRVRKSRSFSSIPNNPLEENENEDKDERVHAAWNRLAAAMFNDTTLETQTIDVDAPTSDKLLQISGKNSNSLFINF